MHFELFKLNYLIQKCGYSRYCTNKIIILLRLIFFYDYSAHESTLKTQMCPQNVIPRTKVPFSLKQPRALFQSSSLEAEHC